MYLIEKLRSYRYSLINLLYARLWLSLYLLLGTFVLILKRIDWRFIFGLIEGSYFILSYFKEEKFLSLSLSVCQTFYSKKEILLKKKKFYLSVSVSNIFILVLFNEKKKKKKFSVNFFVSNYQSKCFIFWQCQSESSIFSLYIYTKPEGAEVIYIYTILLWYYNMPGGGGRLWRKKHNIYASTESFIVVRWIVFCYIRSMG